MRYLRRARLLALGLTVGILTIGAAGAQALNLGFSSDPWLVSGTTTSRAPWMARAVNEGASFVRVNVIWARVAPTKRPAHFNPTDPGSPAYNWSELDSVVKDLTAHHLKVVLTLLDAPTWAEAPGRPQTIVAGAWRPSAKQFAKFATAAARRYDGRFPDPSAPGADLPRVHYWQAWDEPNINYYFAPQWVRSHHHWKFVSPGLYRKMLNAFYRAVKGVSRSNFVLMAGTAPFGDVPGTTAPGYQRTAPVAFYRDVFCLRGRQALVPYHCPAVHLDGIDHHPFAVKGPTWHALNADDAAVADIYKLTRVLKTAVRDGHVRPRGRKPVWVTELAWSSNPPNPHGVPVAIDARWYEQALYVLWRQGVSTVLSLELGDPGNVTSYSGVFESGLYYSDGRPKLIATAWRFPFVIQKLSGARVRAWGRAPQAGRLKIERRQHGRWRVIRTIHVGRWQVFAVRLRFHGKATWRATIGSASSLSWTEGAYARP